MTKIRQFTRANAQERESRVVYVTDDFKLVGVPLEGWAIAEDPLEDFSIISPVVYSRYRDQMYPAFELAEDTGVGHHRSLLYGRAVLGVFFQFPEPSSLDSTDEQVRHAHIENVKLVLLSHGSRTGDAAWVERIALSELGVDLAREWWEIDGRRIRTNWVDGSGANGEPDFDAVEP